MPILPWIKLAATLAVGLLATACMDAKVEVEVQSGLAARATLTEVMTADFYAMVKMNRAEHAAAGKDDFCAGGTLTENPDGTATCVQSQQGPFRTLTLGSDTPPIRFEPAGPGLVRVSLPAAILQHAVGGDEPLDAESEKMLDAFFKDRSITVRFAGAAVTDTNMEPSADGTAASTTIPLLDLIKGAPSVPQTLYAVVRVP